MTADYKGDLGKTLQILNDALATELVCVLRYKFHAVSATGIDSGTVTLKNVVAGFAYRSLPASR